MPPAGVGASTAIIRPIRFGSGPDGSTRAAERGSGLFAFPITREKLSGRPSRLLSAGRNRTKADVRVFEIEETRIILKDFRSRGLLVRNTIGRFSIARECRAYERMGSLRGIARFHGRVDPFALACAFVPGRPLPDHGRRSLPAPFFRALSALLAAVHERGVAIGDLHHRNVIVEEGSGEPALVDFSLAMTAPASWNLPGRWIFERAGDLDRLALERIRLRYESPSEGVGEPSRMSGSSGTSGASTTSGSSGASGTSGEDPRLPGAAFGRLYVWGRSLKRLLRRVRGRS